MLYIVGFSYIAALLYVAIIDIAAYHIPNRIVLALCLIFPVGAVAAAIEPVMWLFHGLGLITAFVVGIMGWHIRLMGGGDVKLIAALGLWTGIHHLHILLIVVALIGGGVTVLLLIIRACARRFVLRADQLPTVIQKGEPVPYGFAISLGGLFVIPKIPLLIPTLEFILINLI